MATAMGNQAGATGNFSAAVGATASAATVGGSAFGYFAQVSGVAGTGANPSLVVSSGSAHAAATGTGSVALGGAANASANSAIARATAPPSEWPTTNGRSSASWSISSTIIAACAARPQGPSPR